MSKKIISLFALLSVFSLFFVYSIDSKVFTVNTKSKNQTEIKFNLPEYKLSEDTEINKGFKKIEINHQEFTNKEGFPDVPVFSTSLAIPLNCSIEIEEEDIIDQKQISNVKISPRQALDMSDRTFLMDDAFYKGSALYPNKLLEISEPMTIRDFQIVQINVYPFQYDPLKNTLVVNKDVKIIIKHNSTDANPVYQRHPHISQAFDPIYRAMIANYDQIRDSNPDYQKPSLLIIHPNSTNIDTYLTQLVNWKKQMGFQVTSASTSQTGTSSSSIKQYITNQYNTAVNPPEYVLLIGDVTGSYVIPTFDLTYGSYAGAGDYPYTHIAGNDLLGDVIIGRLTIDGPSALSLLISKIMFYDKYPTQLGSDWMNRSILVGDTNPSGYSCISTNKYIKEVIQAHDPDHEFTEVYGSYIDPTSIRNAASQGGLTFNYRGYYNMNGFDLNQIDGLNNVKKLFTAVWITCNTGDFSSYEESRIERALKLGSNANPKGAITAIGMSTSHTLVAYNNLLASAIYEGLNNRGMTTMGQALLYSKLRLSTVYKNTGGVTDDLAHWCNLLGDPSLNIYTDVPTTLQVTHPTELYNLQTSMNIMVTNQNLQAIENATVCLSSTSGQYFYAKTDENGKANIYINSPVSGTLQLVVNKANCLTYISTINVSSAAFIELVSHDISDATNGNNDQLINSGETISINTSFRNNSAQALTNIQITMLCDSPYISLTDTLKTISLLSANTLSSLQTFIFNVKADCPDDYYFNLRFRISSGATVSYSNLLLNVKGIRLEMLSLNIPNVGSVFPINTDTGFYVTIKNEGSILLNNIMGALKSLTPLVNVSDSLGMFNNLGLGAQSSNSENLFIVKLNANTLPSTQLPMQLILYNNNIEIDRLDFSISTRQSVNGDPLGPDEYGYVIYDQSDVNYTQCPVYNWIEIANNGTNIGLYDNGDDQDAITGFDLPFNFRFYGEMYDHITISSNGWFVFGETEQTGMRNLLLPGAGAPYRIVAPFWADLIVPNYGTSGVFTYYDQANHYLVIEWHNAKNFFYSSGAESSYINFQVILYDSQYYQEYSFDGGMKFQYKDFHPGFIGYQDYPSNYFTTGIQNQNGTVGLTYAYKNIYSSECLELSNQTSILISSVNNINNNSAAFVLPNSLNLLEDTDLTLDLTQYIVDYIPENANNYTVTISAPTNLNATVSNLQMHLTPEANWSGTASIFVTLNINNTDYVYRFCSVHVLPLNDPPYIIEQLPEIVMNDNNVYTGLILTNYVNDFDLAFNDHLSFSASFLDSISISFNGLQTIITPAHNWSGQRNVTFTAIDDSLCQVSLSTVIIVNDVNEAPQINFPSLVSGFEDIVLNVNLENYIMDIDNDYSELQIQAYNTEYSSVSIDGSIMHIMPALNFSGYDNIIVTASDLIDTGSNRGSKGLISRLVTIDTLRVKFTAMNDAPIINAYLPDSLDFHVATNTPVNFSVSASDLDSNTLYYYWFVNNINQQNTSNQMTKSFVSLGDYVVKCKIMDSSSSIYNTWNVHVNTTAEDNPLVNTTLLDSNYPNPFNPDTKISFQIKDKGAVKISIYNSKGQLVRILVDEVLNQGKHSIVWNGVDNQTKNVASGIYFYEMKTNDYHKIRKMILIK